MGQILAQYRERGGKGEESGGDGEHGEHNEELGTSRSDWLLCLAYYHCLVLSGVFRTLRQKPRMRGQDTS